MGSSGNYRGDNNDTKIVGSDGITEVDVVVDGSINRMAVSNSGDDLSTESQGRVRVAENTVVFDSYFVNSDRASSFNKKETTGGTVTRDASISAMKLQTTTASGSRAVYQSPYFHYVAGQTFLVGMTGVFGATDANCKKRMGYFDDNDGIYLEYDGTNLSFNIRTSVTGGSNQSVNESSFNQGADFTFDPTKFYLWQIAFLWQGGGPVTLYVFDGPVRIKLHVFENSGVFSTPYMKTPNLPIRYEIINSAATASAQSMTMSCVQLSTEGRDDVGIQNRSASNTDVGGTAINTSTFKPLISVRLKSGFSRALIRVLATRILATSNDDIAFRLYKNATLTGASFTSAGTNSTVEFDVSATAVSGGVKLDEGFVAKSGGAPSELADTFEVIQSDFDGTSDILTLAAISLTSSATVYGALTWTELF